MGTWGRTAAARRRPRRRCGWCARTAPTRRCARWTWRARWRRWHTARRTPRRCSGTRTCPTAALGSTGGTSRIASGVCVGQRSRQEHHHQQQHSEGAVGATTSINTRSNTSSNTTSGLWKRETANNYNNRRLRYDSISTISVTTQRTFATAMTADAMPQRPKQRMRVRPSKGDSSAGGSLVASTVPAAPRNMR